MTEYEKHPLWRYFHSWFYLKKNRNIEDTPGYEWKQFWECFLHGAFVAGHDPVMAMKKVIDE